MKKLTFRTLSFFILLSCGRQNEHKVSVAQIHPNAGFRKDVAKFFQDSSLQKLKTHIEQKLGLLPIENGSEGMEIRIWRGYGALVNEEDLLVIRQTGSGWGSVYFKYSFGPDITDSLNLIDHIRATKKTPKSDWVILLQNILNLGVLELREYRSIKNYRISMDADGVTIEYADPHNYRIFNYPDPFGNKTISEANKITDLLHYLEKEFDIENFAAEQK